MCRLLRACGRIFLSGTCALTYWGLWTLIYINQCKISYVSNVDSRWIRSFPRDDIEKMDCGKRLSPVRSQSITWTNDDLLWLGHEDTFHTKQGLDIEKKYMNRLRAGYHPNVKKYNISLPPRNLLYKSVTHANFRSTHESMAIKPGWHLSLNTEPYWPKGLQSTELLTHVIPQSAEIFCKIFSAILKYGTWNTKPLFDSKFAGS